MGICERYPHGAEWTERMRFAGYEPVFYQRHDGCFVGARGKGRQRDKKVFARIAHEVDQQGQLREEVIAYLSATEQEEG